MTIRSYFHTRARTTPRVTMQTESTTSITPLTKTYNIPQHPRAQETHYLLQWPLHNKRSHRPHSVTTADIKTNMRHIHTSIVSRQLATRGNNTIQRTPPPHINSFEEMLPRLSCRTLPQVIFTLSRAKTHPSPLCPTHNTHYLQLHPHTFHTVATGLVDRPRRSD